MPLTVAAIKAAKPRERGFKLAEPVELLPQPGSQGTKPLEVRTEEEI